VSIPNGPFLQFDFHYPFIMIPGSSIIRDVKITGTIECSDLLFLDCQFKGDILSTGSLVIGENARVEGRVEAAQVTVHGSVKGNIRAKDACHLKMQCRVEGDVLAGSLSLSEGAVFHGMATVPFPDDLPESIPSPCLEPDDEDLVSEVVPANESGDAAPAEEVIA
jgi:cytoskeletal protein CcmA (bactofilin family)